VRTPFKLIQSCGSTDTERCTAELHAGAKSKKLLGLAYIAIYSQRQYEVHLCGEADRSPTFTLGCVQMLDQQLRERIQGQ
jgi:hypothetical protein